MNYAKQQDRIVKNISSDCANAEYRVASASTRASRRGLVEIIVRQEAADTEQSP